MTKLLPIIVAVVATGGLAASGCTVNSTTNNNGDDGGGADSAISGDDTGTNTDTGVETDSGTSDGGTEASTPQANIRLANWSPDSPTAGYDFCVSPHGANMWSGPQLAQAMVSLAFPTVTTYFQIDAGQYDVEIIAAGQTDCTSDAAAPVISNLAALAADSFYTLAFVGDTAVAGSDATLTAVLYGDDAARTDGNVNVRFLNAAPSLTGSTTVDFGTGAQSASTFSALETGVAFAALATVAGGDAGTPDTNGYVVQPAYASATEFSAHTTTGSANMDTATASSQMIAANSSATLVLINGKTGLTAPKFLVCQGDGTTPATGNTSNCTQVSQ